MSGIITFHFDGPIVQGHQISVRVLSRTLIHLQSAIDRAYLDVTHGRVWKNARLTYKEYQKTEFIVGRPQDGGYILDLVSETAGNLVSRIGNALRAVQEAPFKESDMTESERLVEQSYSRKAQGRKALSFESYLHSDRKELSQSYGNRSIAKEIDQILPPIKAKDSTSTFDLTLKGENSTFEFSFDKTTATEFHTVISRRELGEALIVTGFLRQLDSGNQFSSPKAKFTNAVTKRDQTLFISSEEDYNMLIPYMQKKRGAQKRISLLASPIFEFNAYEPHGGDLYFLGEVELDE